jgi:hypothetical protein
MTLTSVVGRLRRADFVKQYPLSEADRKTFARLSSSDFDPDRTLNQVHSFDHLVRADEQRCWHLDA